MEEAGITLREEYICSVSKEELASGLEHLLALPEPPTALLATNDITLAEILKYANRNAISIPEQLSVIGIDDAEFAQIYNPVITTIRQPAYEMGMQAAKIILSCIEDKGSFCSNYISFPADLAARAVGEVLQISSNYKRECPAAIS